MHKLINETVPDYLVEILPNAVNVNKHYNFRNEDSIEQFQCRTEKFRKSLIPDCIHKWNGLEKDLKNVKSHTSFKNKITETEKCSPLYYIGERKFNILHAQLRMNCSNLNSHLYGLHVIDSPACACSHDKEDTAHFFLDCPLYYTERLKLRDIATRLSKFKLETLLFGDENIDYDNNVLIVQAVHQFIED